MLRRIREAAERLAISPQSAWRLVDEGKLQPVRLTKSRRGWRFTTEAVENCIKACQSETVAAPTLSMSKSVADELDAMLRPRQKRASLKLISGNDSKNPQAEA